MIHVHVCYQPNLQPQGWRYLFPRLDYDNVNGTKNAINKSIFFITILFAQWGEIIVLQGNTTSLRIWIRIILVIYAQTLMIKFSLYIWDLFFSFFILKSFLYDVLKNPNLTIMSFSWNLDPVHKFFRDNLVFPRRWQITASRSPPSSNPHHLNKPQHIFLSFLFFTNHPKICLHPRERILRWLWIIC